MGGCDSPTLANIFLGHYEKLWPDNCPPEFKPVMYRRYVDDTFILCKRKEDAKKFLNYMNSQHTNRPQKWAS